MPFLRWVEYFVINLAAATAIALDACLVILILYPWLDERHLLARFSAAVGATHIIFPLVGFIGGWALIKFADGDPPPWTLAVGLCFVGGALLAWRRISPGGRWSWAAGGGGYVTVYLGVLGAAAWLGGIKFAVFAVGAIALGHLLILIFLGEATDATGSGRFWLLVMGVSYDALLTGPGKTVIVDRYPTEFAWASFALIGFLVWLETKAWTAILRRGRDYKQLDRRPGALKEDTSRFIDTGLLDQRKFLIRSIARGIDHRIDWIERHGVLAQYVLFSFFLLWSGFRAVEVYRDSGEGSIRLVWVVLTSVALGVGLNSFTRWWRSRTGQKEAAGRVKS